MELGSEPIEFGSEPFEFGSEPFEPAPSLCSSAPSLCSSAPSLCSSAPSLCSSAPSLCGSAPSLWSLWSFAPNLLESLRSTTRPAQRRACERKKSVMQDKTVNTFVVPGVFSTALSCSSER